MRKHRHIIEDDTEVDMTPMLDIVFIMLIFFIVTTSFIKEAGIEIARPTNDQTDAPPNPTSPIVIRISDVGDIKIAGRLVDVGAVQANIETERSKKPKAAVIVQVDKAAHTGILVSVVDQAKKAGIPQVMVIEPAE